MIKNNPVNTQNAIVALVPKETAVSYNALDSRIIFLSPPTAVRKTDTASNDRHVPAQAK